MGSVRHNAGVVHPFGVPGRLTPFATAAPSLHYFWSSSRRLFAAGSAQVSTPGFDLQRLDEAFVRLQVRHNEAYSRKQLPKVKLHLGHHPARLVDLRLGESGVSTEHHLLAGLLLPFDLRQQSSQPSALCTLPGRSFAASQSPSRLNNSKG